VLVLEGHRVAEAQGPARGVALDRPGLLRVPGRVEARVVIVEVVAFAGVAPRAQGVVGADRALGRKEGDVVARADVRGAGVARAFLQKERDRLAAEGRKVLGGFGVGGREQAEGRSLSDGAREALAGLALQVKPVEVADGLARRARYLEKPHVAFVAAGLGQGQHPFEGRRPHRPRLERGQPPLFAVPF
jgi:hypothetical protein